MKDRLPDSKYAVHCPTHGEQGLTEDEYKEQMDRPGDVWKCPICGRPSQWDDGRYENPPLKFL